MLHSLFRLCKLACNVDAVRGKPSGLQAEDHSQGIMPTLVAALGICQRSCQAGDIDLLQLMLHTDAAARWKTEPTLESKRLAVLVNV